MKTKLLHCVGAVLLVPGMLGIIAAGALDGNAEGKPASPPTLEEVMAYLSFDAEARRKLLAGEIISGTVEETTDRELAVSVAMREARPLADVVKMVHDMRDLEPQAVFQVLGDPPDEAGFAKAGFKHDESNEAAALLKAEPGSSFNLSSDEYQRLAALARKLSKGAEKTPTGLEAISGQYRQFLRDRYAAYRARGLSGIAGYDRGGGQSSEPQDDLLAATSSSDKFLGKYFPQLQRSLTEYPDHHAPGLKHQFFWLKQSVEDRPTIVLLHRLYLEDTRFALIVERQYYVGHSYNVMQVVVGCLPYGDGTLVFYTNRTATESVAGFGSGLAHLIGRDQLRKEIVDSLKRLRDSNK